MLVVKYQMPYGPNPPLLDIFVVYIYRPLVSLSSNICAVVMIYVNVKKPCLSVADVCIWEKGEQGVNERGTLIPIYQYLLVIVSM
jgi:hypothetical protein